MPAVKYITADSVQPEVPTIKEVDKTAASLTPKTATTKLFYEVNGYISMESANYTKAINANGMQWKVIPDIGKTVSGITSFPVTVSAQPTTANSPHLQYEVYTYDTGVAKLQLYFSPTLPFNNTGLQYAVSIDDEQPQIINMHKDYNERIWNKWVADNIVIQTSKHHISKPGKHIIKYWLIDPAIVLQKLVIDFGGVKQSYLGPPETAYKK